MEVTKLHRILASTVMFPCKYSSGGCTVSLLHTEKVWSDFGIPCSSEHNDPQVDHEETCEFRPYSCPCPGASCKWQGSLEQVRESVIMINLHFHSDQLTTFSPLYFQVIAHLMQVHKSITTLQGEDIVFLATDINLPGNIFTSIGNLPFSPPIDIRWGLYLLPRCCGLGDDAKLFRAPLHACAGEAGEV